MFCNQLREHAVSLDCASRHALQRDACVCSAGKFIRVPEVSVALSPSLVRGDVPSVNHSHSASVGSTASFAIAFHLQLSVGSAVTVGVRELHEHDRKFARRRHRIIHKPCQNLRLHARMLDVRTRRSQSRGTGIRSSWKNVRFVQSTERRRCLGVRLRQLKIW